MDGAVGLDHTKAKQGARRPGKSRDIIGDVPLIDRLEPLVRLGKQRVHALGGRQMSGRDIGKLRLLVIVEWRAHLTAPLPAELLLLAVQL